MMPHTIYVGNLHPECTEATLFQKFSHIGRIQSVRVCRDRDTNRCLGYGYVSYCYKSDAEKALDTLNYDQLKGRPLRLMWRNSNKADPDANLIVQNLGPKVDEKTLVDVFGNHGKILSCKVARKASGESKGFGFVQFEEVKSAESALTSLNDKIVLGKKLIVCKFVSKEKKAENFKNVYLKNLKLSFTDQDLEDMCERFGSIGSAKVMLDENGKSRGFGFVSFKESQSAKDAVEGLNGMFQDGKRLYVGRAKSKSERQRETWENLKKKLQSVMP